MHVYILYLGRFYFSSGVHMMITEVDPAPPSPIAEKGHLDLPLENTKLSLGVLVLPFFDVQQNQILSWLVHVFHCCYYITLCIYFIH